MARQLLTQLMQSIVDVCSAGIKLTRGRHARERVQQTAAGDNGNELSALSARQ